MSDTTQVIIAIVAIVSVCVTIWLSVTSRNQQVQDAVGAKLNEISSKMSSLETTIKELPELWKKVAKQGEDTGWLMGRARTRRSSDYDRDDEPQH